MHNIPKVNKTTILTLRDSEERCINALLIYLSFFVKICYSIFNSWRNEKNLEETGFCLGCEDFLFIMYIFENVCGRNNVLLRYVFSRHTRYHSENNSFFFVKNLKHFYLFRKLRIPMKFLRRTTESRINQVKCQVLRIIV